MTSCSWTSDSRKWHRHGQPCRVATLRSGDARHCCLRTHPQRVESENASPDLCEAEDDSKHKAQAHGGRGEEVNLFRRLNDGGLCALWDVGGRDAARGGVVEQLSDGEGQREREANTQNGVNRHAKSRAQAKEPVSLVEDADQTRQGHQAREYEQRISVRRLREGHDPPRNDTAEKQEEKACIRGAKRNVHAEHAVIHAIAVRRPQLSHPAPNTPK